jgi:hypothetical protein
VKLLFRDAIFGFAQLVNEIAQKKNINFTYDMEVIGGSIDNECAFLTYILNDHAIISGIRDIIKIAVITHGIFKYNALAQLRYVALH